MSVRTLLARLAELFRRRRLEREFAEELQQHIDLLTDEFVGRGLPVAEARQAARRELGGVGHVSAAVADVRGFRWLDSLALACRHGVRRLIGTPGFTAAALLILGLGIGVTTGLFSVVDAVLLRPLPYPAPEQLILLVERNRNAQVSGAVAPANLVDYGRRSRTVSRFGAYSRTGRNVSGETTPDRLAGEEIDEAYFQTLGVNPIMGRAIQRHDLDPGAAAVVVIAESVWRTRFGRRDDVLSHTLELDGVPHRIVGVMPADFRGVSDLGAAGQAAFWLPMKLEPDVRTRRTEFILRAVGRLEPNTSVDSARAELTTISEALATEYPELANIRAVTEPLGEEQFAPIRPLLVSLLAAVGLVLLIACINIANLLVVRGSSRQREIAVRYAMGASRTRVIGELLVESLILGGAAAAAALALGAWTTELLLSFAPASIPRIAEAAFDLRSFAVTAALGIAVSLVFGLLPAFQVSRSLPADVLKATDRRAGGGWMRRSRTLLLTAEITLSIVLLVGAGLMVRSLIALNGVDLGFNPAGVLNATVPLPESKYSSQAARHEFFERAAARAASIPGVTAVAFANGFPLRGGWSSGFVVDPIGPEPPIKASTGFQAVSPDFFRTLGIRLQRGRLIVREDGPGSEPVAVVSETFAPAVLAGGDPLGRRFRRGPQAPVITIVGVVSDIRRGGRTTAVEPQVYLPASQTQLYPTRLAELAIRVDGEPAALIPRLRDAVWSVDPTQPLVNVRTLDETLSLRQAERNFHTVLFGLFAVLALVLAVTGVYSLAAYIVSQRTPEIGVRMALGATGARILTWIVGQSLWPIAAGTVAGLAIAVVLSDRVSALLFNTSPLDPTTYVWACALLVVAAGAAILAAGWKAVRIDPVVVLK